MPTFRAVSLQGLRSRPALAFKHYLTFPRRHPCEDDQHQLAGVVLQRIACVPHHG
jgi:hypothetical protein